MTRMEARVIKERAEGTAPPIGMCNGHRILKTTGERKPCRRKAIPGGFVCEKHGGASPQAKLAAARRLVAEIDPTIARLLELRDQNVHLPTAFNASKHIIDRVLGLIGKSDGDDNKPKAPVINVGIAIGGIPNQTLTVRAELPEPEVVQAEDADYMGDDAD